MSQRSVTEGGYCFYQPDEDFKVPIYIGKRALIYGWPMPGSCFDTVDEALAWMAAQPLTYFWDFHPGGPDAPPRPDEDDPWWANYRTMECIIRPVADVKRIIAYQKWLSSHRHYVPPEQAPLRMERVGWLGEVIECRALRSGERDVMGPRRRTRAHIAAMKGVSKIMDAAGVITIPPALTNTSW